MWSRLAEVSLGVREAPPWCGAEQNDPLSHTCVGGHSSSSPPSDVLALSSHQVLFSAQQSTKGLSPPPTCTGGVPLPSPTPPPDLKSDSQHLLLIHRHPGEPPVALDSAAAAGAEAAGMVPEGGVAWG